MATETMHCAVGFRNTTVTHNDCYLVNSFWQASPEVPVCCRIAKVCLWIAFNSAIQIRELQWIADKEYRCVVTYKVPVTFFCIEFYSKPTNIALCISGTTFASNCGETYKQWRLLAYFREKFCFCIFSNIVRYCESTKCAGPFCMHTAFRNYFTRKMT